MAKSFKEFAEEKGYINTHRSTFVNETEGKEFGYNGLAMLSRQPGAYAEIITCVDSHLAGYVGFEKAFQELAKNDAFIR